MKTDELTGAALDWAVVRCEGFHPFTDSVSWIIERDGQYIPIPKYSTDWAQGGPIIERERMRIDCPWNPGPYEAECKIDGVTAWTNGSTILIAAMRCYVMSRLGDEVIYRRS